MYSISARIQVGKSYQVRIAAKNYWGWGKFSEVLTITAASFPEQVAQPSTGIDESTGGLRIEWIAPFDNSAKITAYLIEAQTLDLNWVSICDGTNALVLFAKRCVEPMSTFTNPATFNLPFEKIVFVRVSAYNENGWGPKSIPNSQGAYVRTPPTYMNAPKRGAETNDHQLYIYWNELSNEIKLTGGSAIVSYGLEWDANTNGVSWYQLSGFSSNSLST